MSASIPFLVGRSLRRTVALVCISAALPASAQTVASSAESAPAFIVKRYQSKAEAGDSRAAFRLALLYERGLVSGQPNYTAAANWYGAAAAGGYAPAQFKRGQMYAAGVGGPMDYAAAAELYRRAAEQGLAEAQFNLAILLQNGIGIERSLTDAIRWYEQAALRGIVPAMRVLGLLYLGGIGESPQNDVEAWAWITLASENGDASAKLKLVDATARLDAERLAEAKKLAQAYRELRIAPK